jgi:hypothetical protein
MKTKTAVIQEDTIWKLPNFIVATISILSAILMVGLAWGVTTSKIDSLNEKILRIETTYASDEQISTIKVMLQGLEKTMDIRLKNIEETIRKK